MEKCSILYDGNDGSPLVIMSKFNILEGNIEGNLDPAENGISTADSVVQTVG